MALKKIVIYEDDYRHADMRLKFRYDRLSQPKFFKTIIDLYLERDPVFLDVIFKKYKRASRNVKVIKKEIKEKNETEKTFGLNKEEIEDIFDIIAKENEDI